MALLFEFSLAALKMFTVSKCSLSKHETKLYPLSLCEKTVERGDERVYSRLADGNRSYVHRAFIYGISNTKFNKRSAAGELDLAIGRTQNVTPTNVEDPVERGSAEQDAGSFEGIGRNLDVWLLGEQH